MQKKLRQGWNLRVPRDLFHDVMYCIDQKALEDRAPGAKKKERKVNLSSHGTFTGWSRQFDGIPEQHVFHCHLQPGRSL